MKLRALTGREPPAHIDADVLVDEASQSEVCFVEAVHVQVAVVVDVAFGGIFVTVTQESEGGVDIQAKALDGREFC